jgi:hypothetical protein
MGFRNSLCARISAVIVFAVMMAMFAVPASAQVLYTNGPTNGIVNGWTINFGFEVSDSFTLTGNSMVTGGSIGTWEIPGDQGTLSSLDWAIGTAPYSANEGSGTATGSHLTDTFDYTNEYGYPIDTVTYSGAGSLSLGPGTYYLSLWDAVVPSGNPVYWDENNGPSAAYENGVGNLATGSIDCQLGGAFYGGTCSEAFQILGTSTATPEPGTLAMLGIGLLCLLPLGLRRRVAA